MSGTPSWLTTQKQDSAPAAASNFETSSGLNDSTASAPVPALSSNAGSSTNDEDDLPGIILFMRLANMGAAVGLMACSIWTMISYVFARPTLFVLAIYATCGGLLICCLETQLKFLRVIIAVNFGFLFNSFWRFIFYILLASVAISYNSIFGALAAAGLVIVAFFNTYVLCRYPSYRNMRDKIAEEEDKRIEARISKEVKRQAIRQINVS